MRAALQTSTRRHAPVKVGLGIVTAAIWAALLLSGVWPVALLIAAGATLAVASLTQSQGARLPVVVGLGVLAGTVAFLAVNRW